MKKRKLMALLLATGMAVSSLAACGGGEKPDPEKEKVEAEAKEEVKAEEKESEEVADGEESYLACEKPKEFTIFLNFNNMPFNPEWEVFKKAAEKTNVSLKGVIAQSDSDEEQSYNLMVGSGELADIVGYKYMADLEKLGRDGGLMPLEDLIKEHAPHIQKVLDEDSRFKQVATALDGHIYQIPKNQELVSAEYWFIRQDWLEKLGLEMPTTVDELHDVLYAFRNEDPNGNGEKDEVPLFDRAAWKMPDEYLYLWDTSLEFYPRDGKMTYEPMTENFKVGMKNIIKWYEEGIIDPEIFTRGKKSRDVLFGGNLGGCTHDWVSTANYNTSLKEEVPGFEVKAFAPPADQNGVIKERTSRFPGVGWGISSQCEDPVAVIKYMDYFFTEEGRDLINWGIEGETYERDDKGEKHFKEEVLNSEMTPLGYLRTLGCQYRIGMCQDGDYEYAFMQDAALEAAEMYNTHPEWYENDMPPYADGVLELKYTPEDEVQYEKIMNNIKPFVQEKFQSWVLGTSDFDADYDEFIKELKDRGIEEAIDINQRAYDTFLANR